MANQIIAIDWSGNKEPSKQREHIWMADWRDGVITLTGKRTRQETVKAVIDASRNERSLVVGFDFAFSYPAWFAKEKGCGTPSDLWQLVKANGENWLSECEAPFWGRPKKGCPHDHRDPHWNGFRKTELNIRDRMKQQPKSPFQIGGAGAVGTGSVRGMPHLLDLQAAGFAIWPFDPPAPHMVIEIYPRLAVGNTRVSQAGERESFLQRDPFRKLPEEVLQAARNSADAFDALCALTNMVEHRDELGKLTQATEPDDLLEGRIWIHGQM
jgi:hypothetical protein